MDQSKIELFLNSKIPNLITDKLFETACALNHFMSELEKEHKDDPSVCLLSESNFDNEYAAESYDIFISIKPKTKKDGL